MIVFEGLETYVYNFSCNNQILFSNSLKKKLTLTEFLVPCCQLYTYFKTSCKQNFGGLYRNHCICLLVHPVISSHISIAPSKKAHWILIALFSNVELYIILRHKEKLSEDNKGRQSISRDRHFYHFTRFKF